MVGLPRSQVSIVLVLGCLASLALPAAATPPADAFCVITIQPLDGFRVVRYTIDLETNLTDRSALWPTVDRNGDGAITRLESDLFRQSELQVFPGEAGMGNKTVTLETSPSPDGQPLRAMYAATWREVGHTFHQRDYQLPETITEAADLETQEVREFRFDPKGDPTRLILRGGAEVDALEELPTQGANYTPPRVSIEYVVIRAPAPWLVQMVEGRTYDGDLREEFEPAAVVEIPAFDTKAPYSITFVNPEALDRYEPGGIPAVGAPFSILALACAVALALTARQRASP